jgi:thioredoxin 1
MKTLHWIAAWIGVLALAAGTANSASREIYPDPGQARTDLAAALKTAAVTHKRVLIDFGGNWCGDCQVLDIYFHNDANRPILESNFVLVHVNIGHMDENVEIAQQYKVPLDKGVPALAVLSENGKLLYSHAENGANGRNSIPGAMEAGEARLFGRDGHLLGLFSNALCAE